MQFKRTVLISVCFAYPLVLITCTLLDHRFPNRHREQIVFHVQLQSRASTLGGTQHISFLTRCVSLFVNRKSHFRGLGECVVEMLSTVSQLRVDLFFLSVQVTSTDLTLLTAALRTKPEVCTWITVKFFQDSQTS
jgi:hypothetical protein